MAGVVLLAASTAADAGGSPPCSWRAVRRRKTVDIKCLESLDLVKACEEGWFAKRQADAFKRAKDVLKRALESDDLCPDVGRGENGQDEDNGRVGASAIYV